MYIQYHNMSIRDTMQERREKYLCPIEATISLIGGKWKPIIIWRLKNRTIRFNQLMTELSYITPKMLTKQLRELEQDGLVEREMFTEIPPRVEYRLTPLSKSLLPVLEDMAGWGMEHLPDLIHCPKEEEKETDR